MDGTLEEILSFLVDVSDGLSGKRRYKLFLI